jgi:hypothetical protein
VRYFGFLILITNAYGVMEHKTGYPTAELGVGPPMCVNSKSPQSHSTRYHFRHTQVEHPFGSGYTSNTPGKFNWKLQNTAFSETPCLYYGGEKAPLKCNKEPTLDCFWRNINRYIFVGRLQCVFRESLHTLFANCASTVRLIQCLHVTAPRTFGR